MKSVIVIGGGVAGLAAAVALADRGLRITLFEKRGLLGGRASSFIDPQTGERIDNCQHVTMRCCTNLEDFYCRIGVADRIRYYDTLRFLDVDGAVSLIGASPLPAPLHTLPSFIRFKSLGWRDKLAVARGLVRILRARPSSDLDSTAVSDWFARTRQTERAIARFWRPILVSACNEEPERIACAYAFMIFRDGFLANPIAYQMGLPSVPLGDLYTEPARSFLEARGGCVRMKEHVDAILVNNGRAAGVRLVNGAVETADHYVSAVPFDLLLKLLPADVTSDPYFANLGHLEFSPITGVHLWFDCPLDAPDATALLDREMQWIFNKTGVHGGGRAERPRIGRDEEWASGDEDDAVAESGANLSHSSSVAGGTESPRAARISSGQSTPQRLTYLGLVVSSARKLAEMPKEEIAALAVKDVQECVPGAREANLVKWHVIKERKATFAPLPGADRWRPAQKSPIPNLFTAGDWTRTGWPATMEGAVRSGYLAAESLLAAEGSPQCVLASDLKPGGLARLLIRKPR